MHPLHINELPSLATVSDKIKFKLPTLKYYEENVQQLKYLNKKIETPLKNNYFIRLIIQINYRKAN